ncbi:hypothetical protein ACRRTK_003251 [Alexandromys fortis]
MPLLLEVHISRTEADFYLLKHRYIPIRGSDSSYAQLPFSHPAYGMPAKTLDNCTQRNSVARTTACLEIPDSEHWRMRIGTGTQGAEEQNTTLRTCCPQIANVTATSCKHPDDAQQFTGISSMPDTHSPVDKDHKPEDSLCLPGFTILAGEICAFKIHGQELPFEAVVLNKTSGEGRLRAKSPIDCELQKEYTFIIQAYDCGVGPREAAWKKSHKAVVHIQVKDVNEFAPTFKEPAYKAIVTEGKIYDSILQVEAIDEDCSPQYSQICNYEIVTTDVPFAIDRNALTLITKPYCHVHSYVCPPSRNIRNTEKLSFDKQRQYEILVTAYDCGQKPAAQDTLVQVDVKPVCKPGWQDWTKRIEYQPGSGSVPLFPSIHLETCDGAVSSLQVTAELQTNYIGKGCDRETYSEKSLQKLCGSFTVASLVPRAEQPLSGESVKEKRNIREVEPAYRVRKLVAAVSMELFISLGYTACLLRPLQGHPRTHLQLSSLTVGS